MDYPYRVFYREGARGRLTVSDAKIVEKNGDEKIFHIDDDNVRAIKCSDEETVVLDKNGEVKETRVDYVWEKLNKHELYVYGGAYYATGCDVYYYGDYNGHIESEGGISLRVNNTEISGSGDLSNNWDWSVLDEGGSSLVEICQEELSDFFDGCGVYIGYEDEIDTFETFTSLM